MNKVFITGGSGFLGRNLIRSIGSSAGLTGIGRSPAALQLLAELKVGPVAGSLSDIDRWEHELEGNDAVVHAAAPVEYWGGWAKFERDVVNATRQLIEASHRRGVRRFVYLSSESVHQDSGPLLDIDETCPYAERPISDYSRAKRLAEEAVLQFSDRMSVIILRPAFIWGPHSPGVAAIAAKVHAGSFVWLDGGDVPFEALHVENAVEAIRLSLSDRSPGGVFLVTDDAPATVRQFFTPIFHALGLRAPRMSVSSKVLEPIARAFDYCWRRLKLESKPPLTRFEVAFLAMPRRYDVARIKQTLGYQASVSREQGLAGLSH